jgi:hypothetical protein
VNGDERRRAYAVLGLPPDASPRLVKRRYKELVRTWHPDRFARDPVGREEAEQRLREINLAFGALNAPAWSARVSARAATPPPAARERTPGQRLTREQIDEMVQAIGTRGPIDHLFASLDGFGDRARIGCGGLFLLAWLAALLRPALAASGAGARLGWLLAALLAFGLGWRWWRRRHG